MPKRIGFLYDKMCDKVFIRTAILEGAVGKHKRADVKAVLEDLDGYVNKTYEMLVNRAYVPTPPRSKRIYDKTCQKERTIQIVPYFPDGIMHWLCVKAMRGVLMRGMYRWSCASIPGRGNKCAWSYVKRALKKDPKGTKYCLKMDIKSYYPSIRPKRLIWALARKIKDKLFLKTVYSIVASNPDPGDRPVTRYEMELIRESAKKDDEIVLLKANANTDNKLAEVHAYIAGATATTGFMAQQIQQLYSITQLVVPNAHVAPGWGPAAVRPFPPFPPYPPVTPPTDAAGTTTTTGTGG